MLVCNKPVKWWIYEYANIRKSCICHLRLRKYIYESDFQGSSENKAGFQFLTGLIFLSGLIFTNVHFLNRCCSIRWWYIHNHWLWLGKPWTNKSIIYSQNAEWRKSHAWLEKLFSIQNYTFCFWVSTEKC